MKIFFPKAEEYLSKKIAFILILLALCALLVRVLYYHEIADSPALYLTLDTQTDMHFFHGWAKKILDGDYASTKISHPYHNWHHKIAWHAYEKEDKKNFTPELGKAMWEEWYGHKRLHQEPLYPYFLAFVYQIFGPEARFVFFLQWGVGILNILLLFFLVRGYFGSLMGILSSVLLLLYGPTLFHESVLLRPSLITFMMLLSFWLAQRALSQQKKSLFFLTGFVSALGFLTKSTLVLFFIAFLFAVFVYEKERRLRLLACSFLLLGFALPSLPLVTRNLSLGVSPLQVSSVATITFINANTPDFPPTAGFFVSKYAPQIMLKSEGKLLPAVWETIKTHPSFFHYLGLLFQKALTFWTVDEISNNGYNYHAYLAYSNVLRYGQIAFPLIGIFSLLGIFLLLRHFPEYFLLYLLLALSIAPTIAFYNLSRFRTPVVVLLIPFAAYALLFALSKILRKEYRASLTFLLSLLLVSLGLAYATPRPKEKIQEIEWVCMNQLCKEGIQDRIAKRDGLGAVRLVEKALKAKEFYLQENRRPSSWLIESWIPLHASAAWLEGQRGHSQKAEDHQKEALRLKKSLSEK